MDYWVRYGDSLYLLLLHGNFLEESGRDREAFDLLFREAVTEVSSGELAEWLGLSWREQLVATWIIAARREEGLRDVVMRELLARKNGDLAGEGLCLALARFADASAAEALVRYLDKYLAVIEGPSDRGWAAGCLVWLDGVLGTGYSGRFFEGEGIGGEDVESGLFVRRVELVARSMKFLDGVV